MSDLKPCDYCESADVAVVKEWRGFYVLCQDCCCRGPYSTNAEQAAELWNTRSADAELERLRADLVRVTAERDDYRERWEQTGCTRHHAMETAIKLNESCREQLESVIQERDRLRTDLIAIQAAAEGTSRTVNDSVGERLWAVKQIARAALNGEGVSG